MPALRRETDHWLAEAERAGTTSQERVLVARIKAGYAHFFAELDRLTGTVPDAAERRQMRRLIDQVLTEEILAPTHEYLDWNEELAARGTARNREMARWLVYTLLLLGGCGVVAGGLAGFGLARRLSHCLIRLGVPIRDASGRLSEVAGPVTLPPGWGLEEMEAALGVLAGQVNAVVERLQQSQREALRAEQLAAVGQMAAGFAHEVRNPLTSMKILVQSAAEQPGAELRGRALVVLEEEIDRLERLTSSFLDFARPPHPALETCDARAVLEDAAELVAGRAGLRDVRLECDGPADPVWLEADPGQLRQVMLNLLLNALEAVPDGGVVRARLVLPDSHEAPDRDGWVEVLVEDSGPGLPAHLGPDIFAPFVSTKETGLGLGLSVCKRITEAHGGEITAANAPAGGAVFRVRLPRRGQESGTRR